MERSHGLRYCEWKRTHIIFLFNDTWTTSASYLRVRSIGKSRIRFWNPDFVRPWIFLFPVFSGYPRKNILRTVVKNGGRLAPAHIISIAPCPESGKVLLVESGIPLTIGVRNPISSRTKTISTSSAETCRKNNFFSRFCHWFFFVQLSRLFVTHHTTDYSVPGAYS